AYLAGRLVQRLGGSRTDAAAAAAQLAGSYADSYAPLAQSSDAKVLRDTGQSADIDFCARESVFDVVPRVSETSEGIAVVEKENFDSATRSAATHKTKTMDHDRTSA
ncbi:MAG: 2-phosphosulfolactate phosphatase, partial [Actinomycetota bacterium]|nr:2-phosphosulfolactate phosphatase [Actinomycetota bacterium]